MDHGIAGDRRTEKEVLQGDPLDISLVQALRRAQHAERLPGIHRARVRQAAGFHRDERRGPRQPGGHATGGAHVGGRRDDAHPGSAEGLVEGTELRIARQVGRQQQEVRPVDRRLRRGPPARNRHVGRVEHAGTMPGQDVRVRVQRSPSD